MKARIPKGAGGGAPANMQQLARQAQKMQEDMELITNQLNETEYTATAGGSMVTAVVMGSMEVKSIDIKPEIVDPEDTEMLSDMVVAAVNEALRAAAADKEEKLGAVSGGINIPGLF